MKFNKKILLDVSIVVLAVLLGLWTLWAVTSNAHVRFLQTEEVVDQSVRPLRGPQSRPFNPPRKRPDSRPFERPPR